MNTRYNNLNMISALRVRAFVALFVAVLLSIGSAFIVHCIEIDHGYDDHHAMHSHEDLSTPQKHSPYAGHNDSSHIHIYQVDVQAVLESLHSNGMSAKSNPAANVAIEFSSKFNLQVTTAELIYFEFQHFQIPQQYNTSIHPYVIVLV